ncbi:hypothetical protein PENTCL1PPCAC_15574, partial [Pristionchus entomophagus]
MPFVPLYLSEHTLLHALFIIYTILIGLTLITCLLFLVILAFNRNTFYFSFNIILMQIICCGFAKVLTRTISYFGFIFPEIYSIELMFDFGVLLFITSMTVNRLLVVSTPRDCFIYSNKFLQCLYALVLWLLLAIIFLAFRTANCVRYIGDDMRLSDTCLNLTFDNELARNTFGGWLGPIFFIRRV